MFSYTCDLLCDTKPHCPAMSSVCSEPCAKQLEAVGMVRMVALKEGWHKEKLADGKMLWTCPTCAAKRNSK